MYLKKTKFIQVRVTETQFERIVNNAQAKGYKTLTAYIRDLALNKDLVFEERFNEIYKIIKAFTAKP